MRNILVAGLLFFANITFGQNNPAITTIDFVKIRNNKQQEALFFYENNWKVYRDIAVKNEYIKSYKLLITSADTAANFDLMLITEYKDSSQYKLREERFQQIIKETSPNGPKLLNELKPNDFRQNLFFKTTGTLFSAEKTKAKRKSRARL